MSEESSSEVQDTPEMKLMREFMEKHQDLVTMWGRAHGKKYPPPVHVNEQGEARWVNRFERRKLAKQILRQSKRKKQNGNT